jgi:hypothetical protein
MSAIEADNDAAAFAERVLDRSLVLSAADQYAPPLIVRYLGADKFIVALDPNGVATFRQGFFPSRDFRLFDLISPFVAYIRCNPGCEFVADAERLVSEEIRLGFLPF